MMLIEVIWDANLKAWAKPYFTGPMNAKVVRRSNAIMRYPYGRDFSYKETALTRSGIGGWWAAMRDTLFGRLFLIAMSIPATRGLLERRVLPKSGEGPNKEVRETGSYDIVQVGEMPEIIGTGLKWWHSAAIDLSCERTTQEVIDEISVNPELVAAFAAQWFDHGGMPIKASCAMHALITRGYLESGAWYPKGGGRPWPNTSCRR